MPAAKKGVASFVAASPAESFDALSTSHAQRSNLGPAGVASLAFSGVAHYEIATKGSMPFALNREGWGRSGFLIARDRRRMGAAGR